MQTKRKPHPAERDGAGDSERAVFRLLPREVAAGGRESS